MRGAGAPLSTQRVLPAELDSLDAPPLVEFSDAAVALVIVLSEEDPRVMLHMYVNIVCLGMRVISDGTSPSSAFGQTSSAHPGSAPRPAPCGENAISRAMQTDCFTTSLGERTNKRINSHIC